MTYRPIVMASGTVMIVALMLLGCKKQDVGPAASASVTAVDAGKDGLSYHLVAGQCANQICPPAIELVRGQQQLDRAVLLFGGDAAELRPAQEDATLVLQPGIAAWTSGSDAAAVTTAIQSVTLEQDKPALLAQQSGGFEHVKRRYDLFAVQNGKLRKLWSAEDGAGPAYSAVFVVPAATAGAQDLVLMRGFTSAEAQPDDIKLERLHWNSASDSLKAGTASLPAVTAGRFTTVAKARAAAADGCHDRYAVVPGSAVGSTAGDFALIQIVPDQAAAASELARPCAASATKSLATFAPAAARQQE